MGVQNYISEHEAATLSGVSCATLQRFVEAGYLQIEVDHDGLRLFDSAEIKSLFGLAAVQAKNPEPVIEIKLQSPPAISVSAESSPPPVLEPELYAKPKASTEEPAQASFETSKLGPAIEIQVSQTAMTGAVQTETNFSQEIARLTHLNSLYEKLLDLKDSEIKDLREQRSWLRSRVEKLEDKGDRDQLLLLSETQMIRRLIANQSARPSPIRQALEWLGIAPASFRSALCPDPASKALEVVTSNSNNAANN